MIAQGVRVLGRQKKVLTRHKPDLEKWLSYFRSLGGFPLIQVETNGVPLSGKPQQTNTNTSRQQPGS